MIELKPIIIESGTFRGYIRVRMIDNVDTLVGLFSPEEIDKFIEDIKKERKKLEE